MRIGNRDATDDDIRPALARAGLALDPGRRIGEAGTTLSGGERRRLAMSRLLVGHPDLVILDEPTEHLDRATATALMDDVWREFADLPLLVLTARADDATFTQARALGVRHCLVKPFDPAELRAWLRHCARMGAAFDPSA